MRVLMMVFPTRTHIYSMTPIGWALAAAGHEVRFAGPRNPAEVDSYLETGLDTMWFGPELDIARHRKLNVDGENAMAGRFLISETRPERYTDEYIRRTYDYWTEAYQWTTPVTLVDEMVRFAKQWQPDLVLWDPIIYAGPLVAKAVGAAHMRFLYAADQNARLGFQYRDMLDRLNPDPRPDSFVSWMSDMLARYGCEYDESLRYGQATIDPSPSCIRYDLDVNYIPVRFVPVNRPMALPRWAVERPDRPRVLLTLGVSNRQVLDQEETSVADLLDGLAELDVEVVATLNKSQLRTVKRLPDNVRAMDFMPMNEVLATCSAIVHQGGGATVGNAVVNGVPQLIVPGTTWSERASALALEKRGNGLVLDLEDVTPGTVRDGVQRMLEEPSFAQAAREVQHEMLTTRTTNDLVPLLERAAADR